MHEEQVARRLTTDPALRQYQIDTLIYWLRAPQAQRPAEEVRRFVGWVLGRLRDPRAIPPLIDLLADEQPDVRLVAALTLAVFGKRAKPRLDSMARDGSTIARAAAQTALEAIDNPASRRTSRQERDALWLARAASGAYRRSSAVPRLLAVLQSEDAIERENAAFALGNYSGKRVAAALITALRDESPDVRATAAEALGRNGHGDAVTALMDALRDADDMVCEQAAIAIGKIGRAQSVPRLIQRLRDSSTEERRWVAFALAQINEHSLDALIDLTHEADKEVRHSAIIALGLSRDHRAVPLLVDIVRKRDTPWEIRAEIVLSLADDGSSEAADALRTVADDPAEIPIVRTFAFHAINRLDGYRHRVDDEDRSIPDLTDAENEALQGAHLRHRERVGSRDVWNHPWMTELDINRQEFRNSNPQIRRSSFRHLLGNDADALLQESVDALGHRSASLRFHGLYALMEHGDPTIISTFIVNLSSKDQSVRRMALGALKRHSDATVAFVLAWFAIYYRGERIVDTNHLNAVGEQYGAELASLLGHRSALVRRGAAQALTRMRDYRAIPHLQAAVLDRSPSVQSAARKALLAVQAQTASPCRIRHEAILGETAFAEVMKPTGVFEHPEKNLVVVTSSFEHGWWPGRDTRFRAIIPHRVSVYDATSLRCLGVMDQSRFSINDIAVHPRLPLIAIATGDYDGGYKYQGRLLLWNIETGHLRSLLSFDGRRDGGPEVTRCSFDDAGGSLELIVRPWDDVEEEQTGISFYRYTVPFDNWLAVRDRDFQLQHAERVPLPALTAEDGYQRHEPGAVRQRLDALASVAHTSFEERWGIWDLQWAGDHLLATRNETAIERWGSTGEQIDVIPSDLNGMQLLVDDRHNIAWVNHYGGSDVDDDQPDWPTRLTRIDLRNLEQSTIELESTPTILSRAASGHLLARGLRNIFVDQSASRFTDMLISPSGHVTHLRDLGHYESRNSHLRIDGAPDLYYFPTTPVTLLQRRPGTTREMPWVCRIDPLSHAAERLFPLEWNPERGAHLFSRSATYISDASGESLIMSCEVYRARHTDPQAAILQRRRVSDGTLVWETRTREPAIAIATVPERGITLAAMGDGYLATFDNATGEIVNYDDVQIDGFRTTILSLAARGDTIAAGTIDGRIIVYAIHDAD